MSLVSLIAVALACWIVVIPGTVLGLAARRLTAAERPRILTVPARRCEIRRRRGTRPAMYTSRTGR